MSQQFLSPLTWIGGKAKFWKQIRAQLPDDFWSDDYWFHDVFSGGSSVALNLFNELPPDRREHIIINDLDDRLFDLWLWIRNYQHLDAWINNRPSNLELAKIQLANLDKIGAGPLKLFYENNLTYNDSKSGTFTQQRFEQNFNANKWNNLYNLQNLTKIGLIAHQDYKDYIDRWRVVSTNDLFFLDPPYSYNQTKNIYVKTKIDFGELKKYCDIITNRGAKFLMTIDNSPQIRELFKNYIQVPWDVKYTSTNKNGLKCSTGKELFVRNYKIKGDK